MEAAAEVESPEECFLQSEAGRLLKAGDAVPAVVGVHFDLATVFFFDQSALVIVGEVQRLLSIAGGFEAIFSIPLEGPALGVADQVAIKVIAGALAVLISVIRVYWLRALLL